MPNETIRNRFIRSESLKEIKNSNILWDIVIIGGGATGLGIALDSASRGYKTLLLEQADFSNGTSSRSTKLAHGGVRYLAQGNVGLVNEALHERGLMLKNAPHLVKMLGFVIPSFRWWEKYFYGMGLKIYDWMARNLRLGKTVLLSAKEVRILLPNLRKSQLSGGILYYDGQFDDARLAINIAQTAAEQGGTLINYMEVVSLKKDNTGKINGVEALDRLTWDHYDLKSKVVINAAGIFVDSILGMNSKTKAPMVKLSQGIHLVLDKSFLNGAHALMIPATSDGRVLFAVPWHDHLLVGTTDTPTQDSTLEPVALEEEISFVLETLQDFLEKKPQRHDVLSVFAGLRPLVLPSEEKGTKDISRDHKLSTTLSGLITITGGKWTTYRKMAEDTLEEAIKIGDMEKRPCVTENLKIHGYSQNENDCALAIYGSDAEKIREITIENPILGDKILAGFPYLKAEVVWAVRNEMAQTVEDVLARRLRILFLDARAAIEMAPVVVELMAGELGKGHPWMEQQVAEFQLMAQKYLLEPYYPTLKTTINH